MLNASQALSLRKTRVYIPEEPVGTAEQCAEMIHEFHPIARAIVGLQNLKIISFGPRPNNFLACNAPIRALYDLDVEIEENSELDLLEAYQKHANDPRIDDVVKDMAAELGHGNKIPQVLPKLAQYELTLTDWIEAHKGSRQFVAMANKCWPAFQTMFGFVPCYVNSRLTARGIPVACEVDIYGALSEYIGTCISQDAVTLLDINNTVPNDMYEESIKGKKFACDTYTDKEIFMGFHCGNTASTKVCNCQMCFQRIMARALPVEVTNGTLEGDILPGLATVYRLQSTADTKLRAYIAQGEVIPVATRSFGSIGIFGIKNMSRFYRHVLIEKHYPHHCARVSTCGRFSSTWASPLTRLTTTSRRVTSTPPRIRLHNPQWSYDNKEQPRLSRLLLFFYVADSVKKHHQQIAHADAHEGRDETCQLERVVHHIFANARRTRTVETDSSHLCRIVWQEEVAVHGRKQH